MANLSELIREALKAGVEKPVEIIAWVKRKYGVEVKPGLVKSVKHKRENEHIRAQNERREFDDDTCQICGSKTKVHAHHIGGYSKGGPSLKANLFTLCEDCHQAIHSDRRITIVQTDGNITARGCGGP